MTANPRRADAAAVSLPLKSGVGIMVLDAANRIWAGRRQHTWLAPAATVVWQMPQGGIRTGEELETAARRELAEETGIRSVEILAISKDWHGYHLPEHLVGVALKGRFSGQRLRWFAMRFNGTDDEIDISANGATEAEFEAWQWADPSLLVARAVGHKRLMVESVLAEFDSYLRR